MRSVRRTHVIALAAALTVTGIAVPVLGGALAPAPAGAPMTAEESQGPGAGPKTGKPGKGGKKTRVATAAVTRTGRIGSRVAADGDTVYTLTVGTIVYDLEAGPAWWWGETHPLKGLVGETATVAGEQPDGSAEIDVRTVNGTEIRPSGRPPWAGGWKVVGDRHPGWTKDKAERAAEKARNKSTGRPPWAGPKLSPEAGE